MRVGEGVEVIVGVLVEVNVGVRVTVAVGVKVMVGVQVCPEESVQTVGVVVAYDPKDIFGGEERFPFTQLACETTARTKRTIKIPIYRRFIKQLLHTKRA